MTPNHLRLGGAVVYWTLSEFTFRDRLADGLGDAGFGDLAPDARPATAALKAALEQTLGGSRVLIRPLQSRDGFAVVEEQRGQTENLYTQRLSARVQGEGAFARLAFSSMDERSLAVQQAFDLHQGLIAAHQVSECLVGIVERLGGTRLRPSGGFYWLPEAKLDLWQEVAAAVEKAAFGRPHACYVLRVAMDADAVRAVRDAIVAEVSAEANRIRTEVLSGQLKERALESRRLEAEDLRDKVALYEQLLDTGLAYLREAIDAAEEAASAAALLISAQPVGAES
jgi:hypothetical protein